MKNKKYPFFKKGDLLVYALIIALGVLSCVFVAAARRDDEYFIVTYAGEEIMRGKPDGEISFDENFVSKLNDITYEVVTPKGRNVLRIDVENADVFVIEADCHGEECMGMSLKKGGIICSPHSLVIKFSSDFGPQAG